MNNVLFRIIVAVIVVVILFAIIPSVLNVFELPKSADILRIIKVVIAGLALLYIVGGSNIKGWFSQA